MIWICRDKQIEYGKAPLLMGIVNVTPDSFSDGGAYFDAQEAVAHALQLERDGADILDLGAQSTRPGYEEVTPEEEWKRLAPVLKELRQKTDKPISVDTYFPLVASRALDAGADIINDVSGKITDEMATLIRQYGAGWVVMHHGAGGAKEVKAFFDESAKKIEYLGVSLSQICFDMGIGFGKSYEENLELLACIPAYKTPSLPLLLGVSRKRVIGTASNQPDAKERIYGNIAAHTVALSGGADIFRVHDVAHEKQGLLMAQALKLRMTDK